MRETPSSELDRVLARCLKKARRAGEITKHAPMNTEGISAVRVRYERLRRILDHVRSGRIELAAREIEDQERDDFPSGSMTAFGEEYQKIDREDREEHGGGRR